MTPERWIVSHPGNIHIWADAIFYKKEDGSFALNLRAEQLRNIVQRNPQVVALLRWETDGTRRQKAFECFTEEECISGMIPWEIKEILSKDRPTIIAQGIATHARSLIKAHRRKGEEVLADILELPKWAELYSGIGHMIYFGHRFTRDTDKQVLTPELFRDMVDLGSRIHPTRVTFSPDDQRVYAFTKTIMEDYCKDPQDMVGLANGMKDFYKQASGHWEEQKRLCSVLLYTALQAHIPVATHSVRWRVTKAITHVLWISA